MDCLIAIAGGLSLKPFALEKQDQSLTVHLAKTDPKAALQRGLSLRERLAEDSKAKGAHLPKAGDSKELALLMFNSSVLTLRCLIQIGDAAAVKLGVAIASPLATEWGCYLRKVDETTGSKQLLALTQALSALAGVAEKAGVYVCGVEGARMSLECRRIALEVTTEI